MQFRLDKINEIKEYFIAEINERQTMTKTLANYVDKTPLVLSEQVVVFLLLSLFVIGSRVGIVRTDLVFSISN